MNIVAYGCVFTDKTDRFNSLETQKEFFLEYIKRTGDNLINYMQTKVFVVLNQES